MTCNVGGELEGTKENEIVSFQNELIKPNLLFIYNVNETNGDVEYFSRIYTLKKLYTGMQIKFKKYPLKLI